MNVALNERYIQITVEDDNAFLHKAIAYAEKYFSKSYRLSRTVLILDDGERFKKNYLINWAYHACLQNDQNAHNHEMQDLEYLLDFTYLPIRIKIVGKNSLVERVKISLRILNGKRVMLKMSKSNATARRYIANLFDEYYMGCDRDEIYLDSTKPYFWVNFINLVSFKVIHNVILDLPGQVPETIVITAHYDSTHLSQGAYDNMSGCVGLLALAEKFSRQPHRYSLRFIWCGSEERGLLGSKAYVAAHMEELDRSHVFHIFEVIDAQTESSFDEDALTALFARLSANANGLSDSFLSSYNRWFAFLSLAFLRLELDGGKVIENPEANDAAGKILDLLKSIK